MPSKSDKPRRNDSSQQSEATSSYFLGLELKNFRCFGEDAQSLDLSDRSGRPARWTILLGENGVGKTTVLQALILFEVLRRSTQSDDPSDPHKQPTKEPRFHLYNCIATLLVYQDEVRMIRDNCQNLDILVSTSSGNLIDANKQRFVTKKSNIQIGNSFLNYMPNDLNPPNCFAYGASRRAGRESLGDNPSKSLSTSLFFDDAELIDGEEWLLRLDYSASKAHESQERPRQRLDQIKALLIEVLPEVGDIKFTIRGDVMPKASVEFKTPFGWVPMRGLGFGYRTLIAWMVDLVARLVERYPESENPLAEPAVVLVDEIDLHLHPTWQRKLIGDLTRLFPNTQFIVTAHSPLIVQAAGEDANIALLRREGDHVVIVNDLDFIKGWRVDQILTSDLFKLPSARPPEYDAILDEQKKLLSKPKLTKADQKRLKEIEAKIDDLPYGESAAQARRMMDLIEETQRLLRKPPGRKA